MGPTYSKKRINWKLFTVCVLIGFWFALAFHFPVQGAAIAVITVMAVIIYKILRYLQRIIRAIDRVLLKSEAEEKINTK